MALFLIRQAADHGLVIPAATSQGYTDIGGFDTATQNAINQITALGISKGTSSSTFSPNDGVSRWQMALFIYRTGVAAGVTFSTNALHNEFGDVAGLSAEAQTAINTLADTRPDPAGHIALGTGLSLFSPTLVLVRWQMALFLTRLLAADNIVAPSGTRVIVTPTETLNLASGQARTYVATFKNADGTPYTGVVGIQLLDVSGTSPVFNNVSEQVNIQTTSDLLSINGTGIDAAARNADCALAVPVGACDEANGVAGTDGVVTFTIRHAGADESVIPLAWEDLDGDLGYETAGNVAPTEPYGVGGMTAFAAGAATEAVAGGYTVTVTKTTKATDVFEGTSGVCNGVLTLCSYFYDANDIFTVDGLASTLADFESALSRTDVVTVTYDPDAPDQSNFALADALLTPLTVTTPSANETVATSTYDVKGTSEPEATIQVRSDLNNNGVIDGGDGTIATGTADVDGNWTVTTPLILSSPNDWIVRQVVAGVAQTGVPVGFTVTQGASAGATLTSTVGADFGVPNLLDPNDTITITFSEPVIGINNGDVITVLDSDGTTGTLTLGTNASATGEGTATVVVTVTGAVVVSGGSGGVNPTASIQTITGFTDDDGETINVLGSGAGRSFSGF
jgi:hypothetical protein